MSDGTGWMGDLEVEGNYNIHANAKLTQEQKAAIAASGESESQWIREAVEERLERERTRYGPLERTSTVQDIDRAILYLKLKKRMIELTSEKASPKPLEMGDKSISDAEKRAVLRNRMDDAMEKHRQEFKGNS